MSRINVKGNLTSQMACLRVYGMVEKINRIQSKKSVVLFFRHHSKCLKDLPQFCACLQVSFIKYYYIQLYIHIIHSPQWSNCKYPRSVLWSFYQRSTIIGCCYYCNVLLFATNTSRILLIIVFLHLLDCFAQDLNHLQW